MHRPLIGITTDLGPHPHSGRPTCSVGLAYAEHVARAGGVPCLLVPDAELIPHYLNAFDAFVFTGGDDARTEEFGQPTHPKASPMNQQRQAFEVGLLRALEAKRPEVPVLGVCLGMQLLSLVSGGVLDQHLPETLATHADHYGKDHEITPTARATPSSLRNIGELCGVVASHHRQAVRDAGRLEVLAVSHDGVIEAVVDSRRAWCVGVQWHPERTSSTALGVGVLRALVEAAVAPEGVSARPMRT
jgi:putative glutamine amidotransferase